MLINRSKNTPRIMTLSSWQIRRQSFERGIKRMSEKMGGEKTERKEIKNVLHGRYERKSAMKREKEKENFVQSPKIFSLLYIF